MSLVSHTEWKYLLKNEQMIMIFYEMKRFERTFFHELKLISKNLYGFNFFLFPFPPFVIFFFYFYSLLFTHIICECRIPSLICHFIENKTNYNSHISRCESKRLFYCFLLAEECLVQISYESEFSWLFASTSKIFVYDKLGKVIYRLNYSANQIKYASHF